MYSLIVTFLLIGLILTAKGEQDTFKGNNATTYVVKFHVSGCNSCIGLLYCIDGGVSQIINSCAFTEYLTEGEHTICVRCPNNKWGFLTFKVISSPFPQDVYVVVDNNSGEACTCTQNK